MQMLPVLFYRYTSKSPSRSTTQLGHSCGLSVESVNKFTEIWRHICKSICLSMVQRMAWSLWHNAAACINMADLLLIRPIFTYFNEISWKLLFHLRKCIWKCLLQKSVFCRVYWCNVFHSPILYTDVEGIIPQTPANASSCLPPREL